MDKTTILDAIEATALEDPRAGLALAQQNPSDSARYWAIVGNALRVLGRYREATAALRRALKHPGASSFEIAEAQHKLAQLWLDVQEWDQADAAVEASIKAHEAAGPAGLPGPPDRGLPAALIVRGAITYTAHLHSRPVDLTLASTDYRRALELAPDPRMAPLSHLTAVHNLALLSIETGQGLTQAQDVYWKLRQRLRELGILESSPPSARIRWCRAVVDWVLLGSSDELGHRFRSRIERQLKTAHRLEPRPRRRRRGVMLSVLSSAPPIVPGYRRKRTG